MKLLALLFCIYLYIDAIDANISARSDLVDNLRSMHAINGTSSPLKALASLFLSCNALTSHPRRSWNSFVSSRASALVAKADPGTILDATELVKHAVLNARACSLAFVPPAAMQYDPYASGLDLVAQVEESSQSGASIFTFTNEHGQQQLLIACRGSASVKNFQTNLDIGPVVLDIADDSDALVHNGFQRAALALWELLKPHLPPVGTGAAAAPVRVTGHSLGGGTATLLSLHLQAAGYTPELMTIAGPRLGNSAFANHFRSKCPPAYHIVHDDDEVLNSNIGLWDRLGFEDVGTVMRCDKNAACIYNRGGERVCDVSSKSLPPLKGVFVDHLRYLGLYIGIRLKHPSVWFRSLF